jgi:hypothetical protein
MREFDTGATRDTEEGKYDYEGFLSPLVLERYAEYMHKNRLQADGKLRGSDNWQKGIPLDVYMKSMWRHFILVWMEHRFEPATDAQEEALCGLLFNAMGYLYELQAHPSAPAAKPASTDSAPHQSPADYARALYSERLNQKQ